MFRKRACTLPEQSWPNQRTTLVFSVYSAFLGVPPFASHEIGSLVSPSGNSRASVVRSGWSCIDNPAEFTRKPEWQLSPIIIKASTPALGRYGELTITANSGH